MEITKELLHELFEYKDGNLYWKIATSNRVKVGDPANYMDNTGYFRVRLNRKLYLTHRIIFFMHRGYLPEFLDHIDGNPLNNEIENLRPVSRSENNYNQKTRTDNTSGIKGVSFSKAYKKWRAYIQVDKKYKHLGYYDSIDKATKVIKKVRKQLHGEFARHE